MLRIFLIVACVLAGGPAWAHAVLLESQPADGAALDRAPTAIVLRFNEPVAPVSLHLLDAIGADRATALPRAQDNEIRLELPDLPVGGYIVSWRVVSGDSHPIGGASVFTIGAAPPPGPYTAEEASRETAWTVAIIVNRLFLYTGLMFAAGGGLFAFLVLRPLRIGVSGFAYRRFQAAAAGIVAAVLAIGLKGGQLAAVSAPGLLQPVIWHLGLATSTTASMAFIVAGLMLVAIALRVGRQPWLELVGSVIALAGLSATGHAASGASWVQLVAAGHALLAGFWLGAFWPLMRLIATHPAATLAAARGFSRLAVPAVLALAVSGAAMALSRISDLSQLVNAPYGQLLVIKLLIVAALLVVAAANRLRTTPALAAGQPGAPAELSRNVKLEIGLSATVLLLTAILSHTPPPGMPGGGHSHEAASGHTTWVSQRNRAVVVEVTPALRGPNALTARFSTLSGDQLLPPEVSVSFSHSASGVEPITRPLTRGRGGVFRLGRIDLPLSGTWIVRVDALIDDFEKAVFEVEVPIRAAAPRR